MFVGVHAMLAMNTGIEEFAISPEEGEAFTKAAQNVLRHYSVETTQKTLDWIALFGTVGGIYGPRVVSYGVKRQEAKRSRQTFGRPQAVQPGQVVDFPTSPSVVPGPHEDADGV